MMNTEVETLLPAFCEQHWRRLASLAWYTFRNVGPRAIVVAWDDVKTAMEKGNGEPAVRLTCSRFPDEGQESVGRLIATYDPRTQIVVACLMAPEDRDLEHAPLGPIVTYVAEGEPEHGRPFPPLTLSERRSCDR
jgi:hypothetical protein